MQQTAVNTANKPAPSLSWASSPTARTRPCQSARARLDSRRSRCAGTRGAVELGRKYARPLRPTEPVAVARPAGADRRGRLRTRLWAHAVCGLAGSQRCSCVNSLISRSVHTIHTGLWKSTKCRRRSQLSSHHTPAAPAAGEASGPGSGLGPRSPNPGPSGPIAGPDQPARFRDRPGTQ